MTTFKFALGAAVVLSTSFAAASEEAREADRDLLESAEHAAADARNAIFAAMNRTDLIKSRAFANDKWATSLASFRPSIEAGTVIGRSEYAEAPPSYLVRYRANSGQIEAWFTDGAIEADPRVRQTKSAPPATEPDED